MTLRQDIIYIRNLIANVSLLAAQHHQSGLRLLQIIGKKNNK